MDVGTEPGTTLVVGEATGVNPLKTGLATASVTAGDTYPDGVEACSVANRSAVGAEAGPTSPHPSMNTSVVTVQTSFVLVVIQFEIFKMELLA